ncbi:pilus assembly PilX N-terminal domain-containing protein [Thermus oshimai]|uniref:pilus assembly PilX N-terminal domain-containing protein n=1 Tax=Thermus oshimai TaxID=56957 RepID=UPI00037B64F0|nr:pilus assembly PilX N-terminal domain-containing protein [Thermus oshimai]
MKGKGFALVTALILLTVLMALLTAYFTLTRIELSTTSASAAQTAGFYAAEAGLNLRAEEVRQKFLGYNRPSGTPPSPTNPCQGSNQGGGDFRCQAYTLSGRRVMTYVVEDPNNPQVIRIPPGELYQNLNAQEYRYSVFSVAEGRDGRPEAILEMRFKSRVVPLFQFAVFYQQDLEFNRTAPMTLEGPVHTNSDLYLDAGGGSTLTIRGQVTAAGRIYRGNKSSRGSTGTVRVHDGNQDREVSNTDSLRALSPSEIRNWNGWMQAGVDPPTIPTPDTFNPPWRGRAGEYWNKADLRVALDLTGTTPTIRVYNPDGSLALADSLLASACPSAFGYSNSFYNNRERRTISMLEVDVQRMLDCIHILRTVHGALSFGLDDTTDGGLVVHLSVRGPDSDRTNGYGVRLRNGRELRSAISGAPAIQGLTLVTDQALYIQGDFNAVNWRPAALMGDSMNLLSNNWANGEAYPTPRPAGCPATISGDTKSRPECRLRGQNLPGGDNGTDTSRWLPQATTTTVNAAVLSGASVTPTQGGQEGGGVHNIFRFHEHWGSNTTQCCGGSVRYTQATFNFTGSIVSLGEPRNVNGPFFLGPPWYQPPIRNWSFDTRFNHYQNLPPLSPRFVYLKQELFVRQFER